MIAYTIGILPNKSRNHGSTCLVKIETQDIVINNQVVDQNNAKFKIHKFKILEISDEFKNNYTACYLSNMSHPFKLNVENHSVYSIYCYLTVRRALCSINEFKIDNIGYYYYNSGVLKKKITFHSKKSYEYEEYYPSGSIRNKKKFIDNKCVFMEEWLENGKLISRCIFKNNIWINSMDTNIPELVFDSNLDKKNNQIMMEKIYSNIEDVIYEELKNNAKIYNDKNKEIFIHNVDYLFEINNKIKENYEGNYEENMENISVVYRLKIIKLLFEYLDSECGKRILMEEINLRRDIIKCINDFTKLIDNNKNNSEFTLTFAKSLEDSVKNIKFIMSNLVENKYNNNDLEEWTQNITLKKENKSKFFGEIMYYLDKIKIFEDSSLKMKIATIIFRYLDTPIGKFYIAENKKFSDTVSEKIKELCNDSCVIKSLNSNNENIKNIALELKNTMQKVNKNI
jgi:hypothetical protein